MYKWEDSRPKHPEQLLNYYSMDTCHVVRKPLTLWQRLKNIFFTVKPEILGYNITAEIKVTGPQDYIRTGEVIMVGKYQWIVINSLKGNYNTNSLIIRNVHPVQDKLPFHSNQYILKLYSAVSEG